MSDETPIPEPATDVGGERQPPLRRPPPPLASSQPDPARPTEPAPAGGGRQPPSRRPPPRVAIAPGGPDDPREYLAKLTAEEVAVVSMTGRCLVSTLSSEDEEARVGALSAALFSLGECMATALRRGAIDHVFVRGEDGYLIVMRAGRRSLLVARALSRSSLGLLFLTAKDNADFFDALVGDGPLQE